MVIIGQDRQNLRNFYNGNSCKIVGPVIRMEPGLILQTICQKWENMEKLSGYSCGYLWLDSLIIRWLIIEADFHYR